MNDTIKTVKMNLEHRFSGAELIMLGKELGEKQINLRKLDDDKKMAVDEWKARISAAENRVNSLANKVSNGYEYRDIECSVSLNTPIVGDKTIRRLDTGEIVKVVSMTEAEKQEELPL